jgi:hypothetical protein
MYWKLMHTIPYDFVTNSLCNSHYLGKVYVHNLNVHYSDIYLSRGFNFMNRLFFCHIVSFETLVIFQLYFQMSYNRRYLIEWRKLVNILIFFPAVIGGGIGGTASAYFLRKLIVTSPLDIHVFESSKASSSITNNSRQNSSNYLNLNFKR